MFIGGSSPAQPPVPLLDCVSQNLTYAITDLGDALVTLRGYLDVMLGQGSQSSTPGNPPQSTKYPRALALLEQSSEINALTAEIRNQLVRLHTL